VTPGVLDDVVLRDAEPADAEPLARCHLACWRETYTGVVDPAPLQAALANPEARTERWQRILSGPHGTLVAVDDGEIIGFASTGPVQDEDADVPLELYALYARQAWWGRGLGHRLLTAALGERGCSLWVLRDNPRARRCYERNGFVPDGTEKLDDYFHAPEIRMVRPGR
jgi:GNAT superfamily N-acetyltransferase